MLFSPETIPFMRVERKLAKGRHSNDELGREVDACRKVLESDGGVAVGRRDLEPMRTAAP